MFKILLALPLLLLATPTLAKKTPEDTFQGQIILSSQVFPRQFPSDSAMIAHMKRAGKDAKFFRYDAKGTLNIEFMAFFARIHNTTEFTGTVYDVTEGRQMVSTFPIYPGQKDTRILQSGFTLDREKYPAERHYMFVITNGYRGFVIAETRFTLKRPAGERDAKIEPTVVDMR